VQKHGLWLERHLAADQSMRILDIGCGAGVYEGVLSSHSDTVVGIDLSRESLKNAAKTDSVGFVMGDAGALPFSEGAFGAVVIVEVLEHVKSVNGCLAEARRVLRAGGRLFITAPNGGFPFYTHGYRIGKREYSTFLGLPLPLAPYLPRVLQRRIWTARCFTATELVEILDENGFDTIDVGFILPAFDGVLNATSRIPGSIMRRLQTMAERFDMKESSWFGSTIAVVAQRRV